MTSYSNIMTESIPQKSNDGVKWTRKVRQLTNEKILNLPKELEFFQVGVKVVLNFDGEKMTVERAQ